jgi:hypothetical protein
MHLISVFIALQCFEMILKVAAANRKSKVIETLIKKGMQIDLFQPNTVSTILYSPFFVLDSFISSTNKNQITVSAFITIIRNEDAESGQVVLNTALVSCRCQVQSKTVKSVRLRFLYFLFSSFIIVTFVSSF